jgi:hypothetical protein
MKIAVYYGRISCVLGNAEHISVSNLPSNCQFYIDNTLAKTFQLRYVLAKKVLARVHSSYIYTLAIYYTVTQL